MGVRDWSLEVFDPVDLEISRAWINQNEKDGSLRDQEIEEAHRPSYRAHSWRLKLLSWILETRDTKGKKY